MISGNSRPRSAAGSTRRFETEEEMAEQTLENGTVVAPASDAKLGEDEAVVASARALFNAYDTGSKPGTVHSVS